MKLISKGAEASIYLDSSTTFKKIVKTRHEKKYRIKELDEKLRKSRNNREIKVLEKLKNSEIPVPKITEKGPDSSIHLEFIEGKKLKDILTEENCAEIGEKIGKNTGILHSQNIIHGDLTTSNMMLHEGKIFLIDFGLSFFSHKPEDKAVDLHLLKQALKSSHHKIFEKCFKAVLENYEEKCGNYPEIMKRLEKVESRGRYKNKKSVSSPQNP